MIVMMLGGPSDGETVTTDGNRKIITAVLGPDGVEQHEYYVQPRPLKIGTKMWGYAKYVGMRAAPDALVQTERNDDGQQEQETITVSEYGVDIAIAGSGDAEPDGAVSDTGAKGRGRSAKSAASHNGLGPRCRREGRDTRHHPARVGPNDPAAR